jgi:hypothetical protein
MAEVRINGRRMPNLQSVALVGNLVDKLESWGQRKRLALTSLWVNGSEMDLEETSFRGLKLAVDDLVEARMETPEQMSYESLQVAQEMAELLVFDLKVVTIQMWDAVRTHQKMMEVLIDDCHLFLTLAGRPIELLGVPLEELPYDAERCLKELDAIAQNVEDATLLCVHGERRDACALLVNRVLPCIERWIGLSGTFAAFLEVDKVAPTDLSGELPGALSP